MNSFLRQAGRCLVLTTLCSGVAALTSIAQIVPATPREPVTTEYHGVKVTDDYQWLEKADDPAVKAWSGEQNRRTRAHLDRLPIRAAIYDQLEEIYDEFGVDYFALQYRTGLVFALRFKPPAQQPALVTLPSPRRLDGEKKIVEPYKLNTNGTLSIDWYVPSLNGKLVAVSLSENGSEEGTLQFFETGGGKQLKDKIPRVQYPTGGGSVAWNADGSGVYYTRYPHPGERPEADLNFYQQIWFHKLGTPVSEDKYQVGKDFPRIAEVELESSEGGQYIVASVANGDGGDYAHWLRDPAGQWAQITRFEDGIKRVEFGRDGSLYLLSHRDAPRGKILRMSLAEPGLNKATVAVKEGDAVIHAFKPSATGIYVQEIVGGPHRIRFLDREGNERKKLAIRPISSVDEMLVRRGDEILFRNTSYTEPYAWYTWEPGTNKVQKTALVGTSPLEFAGIEVVRETAVSKDGTKVPMSVIRHKGMKLDGSHPTLLTGYGGYGISLSPDFDVVRRLWLDAGGVYVVANLRGGGEFGEDWHKAGNLARKQNVFDDFAACAEFLIQNKYTNPRKLAVEGGSNGGLLMGAFLTQHPELARAVVAQVGFYDSLRAELEPNGEFNVTEFGTVKDAAQFQALYAYSPYHHVRDGTDYPAVFLLTGDNDGRVNPSQSRKMTARLQAANRGQNPILLRTSSSSGHGMGSSLQERMEEESDVWAFLLDVLEANLSPWISSSPVERGPWAGAVTPNSAWVKAKLSKAGSVARLVLSRNENLSQPIFTAPSLAVTNHGKVVQFPLSGLQADTPYHYALEVDGKLELEKRGSFRTFPAGAASFTFAYGSCAKTGSTNAVFDVIRQNHPLFFMNIGDFHYQNIGRNDPRKFRRAYDRVLGSSTQGALYRSTAFAYIWDDHDFGGDNSNRKASSHEAARLTYEEYVPHYPLACGDGDVPIYQSFSVGRAKFILTDLRSERDEPKKKDDADKTMMGVKQKAWFKQQLLEANGKYPLIFWVSSVPWIGTAGTNYYPIGTNKSGFIHHTNINYAAVKPPRRSREAPKYPFGEDHWSVFSTERREIADFIKTNHIKSVAILHGDAHMLAADDGTDSDYATGGGMPIPVMAGAPLDRESSIKGGLYSQGIYKAQKGEGCFGLVSVKDDGKTITVTYSGRNNKNEEKVSLKFTVPGG